MNKRFLGFSRPDPPATGGGVPEAPNDSVYYGRRNSAWTNLKTYFDTLYAVVANGVTNGDTHDHNGGDGGTIAHTSLSSIGTNTHAQIDTQFATTIPATYQAIDSDLTAIAALAPANDDIIQRKAGAWTNRTIAQLLVDTGVKGRSFLPFGVYTNLSPMTISPSNPYAQTIDRNITLISWSQMVYVATTNNATNYWTISLIRISDIVTINEINTSAVTVNVSTLITDTTFITALVTASHVGIYISCTKTGTPGSLYLFGPLMEVQID